MVFGRESAHIHQVKKKKIVRNEGKEGGEGKKVYTRKGMEEGGNGGSNERDRKCKWRKRERRYLRVKKEVGGKEEKWKKVRWSVKKKETEETKKRWKDGWWSV